jgi:hypothetical protein
MENDGNVVVVEKSGRRAIQEYTSNPSAAAVSAKMKVGTKRIPNAAGNKCMIVSEGGEVLAPAGVHEVVELDRSQFVKVFPGFVGLVKELSTAAGKVFEYVYNDVLNNPNTDLVTLHEKIANMPRTTFHRGLTELLEKEILYKSIIPAQYYINVAYMFNGNRLAYIKEFRLKGDFEQDKLPGLDQ